MIEAFGRALPDLAAATRVWRDLFPSAEEVYTKGIAFIKSRWVAVTIPTVTDVAMNLRPVAEPQGHASSRGLLQLRQPPTGLSADLR